MAMTLDGSNGVTFNDSSLQGAAASPYVLKNRIINGDMVIDQRNAGASLTQSTANQFAVDRTFGIGGVAGKFTMQQSSTAPTGFTKSLLVTSTSSYSVPAGDLYLIGQSIEGFNVADLGWGTANAKTVTLSFWVRSSLTGTFGGAIGNAGWLSNTRSYPFSYTISSANTWEQKSITIAGDTTGTWATNNTTGLTVSFGLGVGTSSSGTAGAWVGTNVLAPTGATSVVGTNGATFYITGVQLEIGTSATPFERRLYNQELANCQRYYWKSTPSTYGAIGSGVFNTTSAAVLYIKHPVSMRTGPTFSYSGTIFCHGTSGSFTVSSLGAQYAGLDSTRLDVNVSGATAGWGTVLFTNNLSTDFLQASSEL